MKELKWVPDNLKKLEQLSGKQACLHGLPLFRLYYSSPRNCGGIYNRIDGTNNMLHAFRIIVGLTWNWLVCNACGYPCSKDTLYYTITAMCRQCSTNKKKEGKLHNMLNVNPNSPDYRKIMLLYQEMLDLGDANPTIAVVEKYFIDKLGKYAQQEDALTTFIPLDVQAFYKEQYGKFAVDQFRFDNQEFTAQFDVTRDIDAWSITIPETELRNKSWLSASKLRRKLNKQGRNSKAKHGRRQQPATKQPGNPAMSTSGSCPADLSEESFPELYIA